MGRGFPQAGSAAAGREELPAAELTAGEVLVRTRQDLLQVSRGYWPARALLSGMETGVFEALGRRALSAATVARRIQADARATRLLLDALVGMGALEKRGNAYAIRRAMVPFLTPGPESALSMLRHHARLWRRWDRLTACVREGDAEEPEGGFRGDAEDARRFTLAMREGALRQADDVAAEVPLRGRRRLLDLGGGPGVYAVGFARKHPGLEVVIVDLPDVCRAGEALVAEEEDVAGRITYAAADLDRDPLPKGADAAFLSHVIHSQTEAEVKALFRKIGRALGAGGLLVVRDFFTSPDRAEPASASLFALNMLVNATGGRSYSAVETKDWLLRAGFTTASYRRSKAWPDTGYVTARLARR